MDCPGSEYRPLVQSMGVVVPVPCGQLNPPGQVKQSNCRFAGSPEMIRDMFFLLHRNCFLLLNQC
jgi:hypothetical protein